MSTLTLVDSGTLEAYLTEVSHIERRSEIKRQVLADNRGFNADELYEFLAREQPSRGIVSVDLGNFFGKHGLTADDQDLEALVALFDHNKDGVVDRNEFKKTVLSQELGFGERNRTNAEPNQEIQLSLLKIFDEELGGIKALERLKTEIRLRGPELAVVMFDTLDIGRKGYVDVRDIHQFLTQRDPGVTHAAASRVVRRLDRDSDNKVTLEEWDENLRPLTMYSGNVFQLLEARTPSQQRYDPRYEAISGTGTHSRYNQKVPEISGDPRSEISYNVTTYVDQRQRPVHQSNNTPNTATLAYSKSPHRRLSPAPGYRSPNVRAFAEEDVSGIPATRQFGQSSSHKQRRPETGGSVVYEDKVTVVDRSPARAEKRTYIRTKFADGTEEVEERIYEPLNEHELRDTNPQYQIKRHINEKPLGTSYYNANDTGRTVESRIMSSRSPLRGSGVKRLENRERFQPTGGQDGYQRQSRYNPSPIKNFRRYEERVEERHTYGQTDERDYGRQDRPTYDRSFDRNSYSKPAAYENTTGYQRSNERSRQEINIRQSQVDHDVSLKYTYPDKERYVHSPARHSSALKGDTAYRREEIYHGRSESPGMKISYVDHDYPTPVTKESRIQETFGRNENGEPGLQEEIITQHEFDDRNNKQINTYIRKIYSPNRDKTVYVAEPQYLPEPIEYHGTANQELPKNFGSPDRYGGGSASKVMIDSYESTSFKRAPAPYQPPGQTQQMTNTQDYIELVRRESEKFKMRDNLATKLSPDLKFSSLSQPEKVELVGCLKTKIDLFKEIERSRKDLAANEEFSISELFKIAKKDDKTTGLTFEDFRGIFDAVGLNLDEKFIKLVFVRSDYDNDGHLSFFEFSELVGPFNPTLRLDMNRRKDMGITTIQQYSTTVRVSLQSTLKSLVEFERETDSTREVTQHRLYSLFNIIDQSSKSLLVLQDLLDVIALYGFSAVEMDLIALIRKFDFNMDGKISLHEFINEMSPLRHSKPFETLRNRGY